MKRTLASLTAGAMLATIAAARAAVPIPTGVAIPVALVGNIAADRTKPGDTFHFKTTSDVRAGETFIPTGTMGDGIVSDSKTAAHHLSSSDLALTPRVLHLQSGTDIAVALSDPSQAKKRSRPRFIPIPIPFVGGLIIGGIGSPAKPAAFADGTAFTVITTAP